MRLKKVRQISIKSQLLLLACLLCFPTEALPGRIDSNAPIRQAARGNYLKSLGETEQRWNPSLNLGDSMKAASESESRKQPLSLEELIRRVVSENQQVQMQKTEWGIRRAEAYRSHAIFEPELFTSLELEDTSQRNTVEESLSRDLTSTYNNRNWYYDLSLETLAPTGAELKLGYSLNRLSNSLTEPQTGEDEEYQMELGLSIRQPLLKNAGVKTTRAGIKVAELESQAAFQEYRLELMQRVGKAAIAYWDYYQAQEQLSLRKDSLRIAKQIALDNRERWRTGKMAETEVLEAIVGVNSRESLLSEAEHVNRQVTNQLRSLLSLPSSAQQLDARATDRPVAEQPPFDGDLLMIQALELRPDYLAAREKLKQEKIKIAFAKNQRKPELDLLASYGLNGLDFRTDDAWQQIEDAKYASWSVGIELRMPLRGGIAERSELEKAKLEKRRQLMELKDIEIELANRIDNALDNVTKSAEQLKYAELNSEIQKQLLEAELARLRAGKTGSRQVLEKEDNYRTARETALKNQVKLQATLVELELAGGTILMNHGVEIMETGR